MTLDDELRRFHAVTVGEASLDDAEGLVVGDAATRMGVYRHAYFARIAGVLAKDYPKLRTLVGEAAFDAWVPPYLRAHPPHDFSLREVGAHLAAFVAEPLHRDLARLERARVEAFDGPDGAVLTRDAVAALPPEEFPSLRLRLVPTAILVELTTNADDVWDAIEQARDVPALATTERAVAVWRRDLAVVHRTLEPDEAGALRDVASGATFTRVCDRLAGAADPGARAVELLLRWIDAELLSAIRT
jgi:hypothetical protein